MQEQVDDLSRHLVRRYGDGVSVEYVDIFSRRMEEFPAVLRAISRGNVPLPVIGFNGKGRFAGGISIEMIGEELEKLGLKPLGE